ncbi:AARP2CN domain protein [Dictyocaulus viviparus]|uniref:Pre-rRNA-processing protein TSR1 homolog n=1 Tax=Dictyocaulus viviparus TaxID=29172 RepID=A0A0D8XWR6_DICVI|nr:AARP2CN domain protein [Dictyocaulus viviparus]
MRDISVIDSELWFGFHYRFPAVVTHIGVVMSTAHQPGVFKRPAKAHKTFKGKRSKGRINAENRGRVVVSTAIRFKKHILSKKERQHRSAQIRANKQRAAFEERRSRGGDAHAPPLITVLAFGETCKRSEFVSNLSQSDDTIVRTILRLKSRVGFLVPDQAKIDDVLDCIKISFFFDYNYHVQHDLRMFQVSDVICFLWSNEYKLNEEDQLFLTIIKSHGKYVIGNALIIRVGLPSIVNIAQNLNATTIGKKREDARKNIQSVLANVNLATNKLFCCDTETERKLIIRHFVEMKKCKMLLQQRRPHMLVEKLELIGENVRFFFRCLFNLITIGIYLQVDICSIHVSGYLRGPSWNVNRLVHIDGWGDFQLSRIFTHADPHPLRQENKSLEESSPRILVVADESHRESLQAEIVPDPMNAEQTWPDEYDLSHAEACEVKSPAEIRKVPKGTSSYQATWIVDEDSLSSDGDELIDVCCCFAFLSLILVLLDSLQEETENNCELKDVRMEIDAKSDTDEHYAMDEGDDMVSAADDGDEEDNVDEVELYRRERENAQFPDEIDTPINDLARIRFQKYRGLKSFRTSPWDPKENLPLDYARIFQFQNYKRTRKIVLKGIGDYDSTSCVYSGQYATLQIERVPVSFVQQWEKSTPMVLHQLLPHEQRMSVLNLVIRRHPSCTIPIMNKQKLIFNVGFRKFEACPVFSQHTNGDKFKMERFLPMTACCVATVYAPITFPPASVLVFREGKIGEQELVATGSVLDNNPDRIILKRIVLSGHPFKINKRSIVCRYMFFHREDVEWFKPVELYTPSGHRGHIKEAVGTHGHMKCRFNRQLNAADSVMMSLYKRVFPKYTYNPRVSRFGCGPVVHEQTEDMIE